MLKSNTIISAELIKNKATEIFDNNLVFGDRFDCLNEAFKYSFYSGGGFLRGFIALECSKLFDVNFDDALLCAAVVEMIHCYSLIYDDLPSIDNSDFRRGVLSCHKKFSESTAILSGNTLLLFALQVLGRRFPQIVCYVSEKIIEMIRGQAIDIALQTEKLSFEEVINMYKKKTGAMFALSCVITILACPNNSSKISLLEKYGYNLGVLFQIKDDLDDLHSGENNIVKIYSSELLKSYVNNTYDECIYSLRKLKVEEGNQLYLIPKNIIENINI